MLFLWLVKCWFVWWWLMEWWAAPSIKKIKFIFFNCGMASRLRNERPTHSNQPSIKQSIYSFHKSNSILFILLLHNQSKSLFKFPFTILLNRFTHSLIMWLQPYEFIIYDRSFHKSKRFMFCYEWSIMENLLIVTSPIKARYTSQLKLWSIIDR